MAQREKRPKQTGEKRMAHQQRPRKGIASSSPAQFIGTLAAVTLGWSLLVPSSSSNSVFPPLATAQTTQNDNIPRLCHAGHNTTIQVTGSWLEFCPCGTTAATNVKQIDPTDGNDNGCVSIQVARVTTVDDQQVVQSDASPNPFSSNVQRAVTDPTTGVVVSGGVYLPLGSSSSSSSLTRGRYYGIPSNLAAFPNGITVDRYTTNYGGSATLVGLQVTGSTAANSGAGGTLYYDNDLTQQPLRSGDRLLYVRCKEERNVFTHNVYLRVKSYGQQSSNLINFVDFVTRDFFKFALLTDSASAPPTQIPFTVLEEATGTVAVDPNSTAASSNLPPFLSVANVFGQSLLRLAHLGTGAHPIIDGEAAWPTFVFGVQLQPAISQTTTTSTTMTTTTSTTTTSTTTATTTTSTSTTTTPTETTTTSTTTTPTTTTTSTTTTPTTTTTSTTTPTETTTTSTTTTPTETMTNTTTSTIPTTTATSTSTTSTTTPLPTTTTTMTGTSAYENTTTTTTTTTTSTTMEATNTTTALGTTTTTTIPATTQEPTNATTTEANVTTTAATTTLFVGGAAARRTTTPVPAWAAPRGGEGKGVLAAMVLLAVGGFLMDSPTRLTCQTISKRG